ncbi:hypothetical protein ACOMHN_035191 [Nucella lapillus]
MPQCTSGLDEEHCWYKKCGSYGFEVNNRCYYLQKYPRMNYFQSSIECTFRGAQLASFNTAEELHSVTDVMWRNRPIAVKVGLYMPSARLPSM